MDEELPVFDLKFDFNCYDNGGDFLGCRSVQDLHKPSVRVSYSNYAVAHVCMQTKV